MESQGGDMCTNQATTSPAESSKTTPMKPKRKKGAKKKAEPQTKKSKKVISFD